MMLIKQIPSFLRAMLDPEGKLELSKEQKEFIQKVEINMGLFAGCPDCDGEGYITFMGKEIEEVCDLCDGEGIIEKQYYDEVKKSRSTNRKEKR